MYAVWGDVGVGDGMIFELILSGVDGQTEYAIRTPRAETIREVLADYDHEGSSISLHVIAEGEDTYKLLDLCDGTQ